MNNFDEIFNAAFAQPLVTERLSIRSPAPADAPAIAAFFHADDMAYARELEWPAEGVKYTPEYISDVVLPHWEEISKNNKCRLFIFEKNSAAIIGEFSFWRDKQGRDLLYYFILPSQRRQGYAAEAVDACLRRAAENGIIRMLHAEVLPGNAASQKILHRLGFTAKGPVCSQISRYEGQTLLAFEKSLVAPAPLPRPPAPSPQ